MTEEAPAHSHAMRGIALRIAAGLVFSMMVALIKLAATWGATLGEILFYRSLTGIIVVALWVLPREGLGGLVPARPWALTGRNLLGVVAMLCSFEALVLLPLAEAMTI